MFLRVLSFITYNQYATRVSLNFEDIPRGDTNSNNKGSLMFEKRLRMQMLCQILHW